MDNAVSFIHPWIQDINTILGMVGFCITIVVWLQVGTIKKSFKSKALLPDIVSDIEKRGSALNISINDWPKSRNEVKATIKAVDSLLNTALQFLVSPEKNEIKRIKKQINTAIKKFDTQKYKEIDAIWDVYTDIQSAIINLKQNSKTMQWN